jgi:hypothetical protein
MASLAGLFLQVKKKTHEEKHKKNSEKSPNRLRINQAIYNSSQQAPKRQ